MSGKNALEDNDFDVEDDATGQDVKEVVSAAWADIRRRLEDQLDERRLQKNIQDYDFDLD
tara:strand:- start:18986 stop:19165 length:180 start_codon:yes stop_codon:yes gene_type:complete